MRVVLDTNVLVSALLAKGGTMETVWTTWRSGRFDVLACEELFVEVREVLERPKLRRLLTRRGVDSLLDALRTTGVAVALREPYPSAPDPDDDFVLALVRDGAADALVTGDAALIDLGTFEGAPIIRPIEFVDALARTLEVE